MSLIILEVVEVDEDQRKLERISVGAVNFRIQHEIQMPRVVEAGAIVGDRQLMNALHVARIFNGDGGVVGQRFQQRQIALAETFGAHAIDQLDHTQALFAKTNRHGNDRARLHFSFFVNLREETGIFGCVWHDDGFAGLRHPTGKSLPQLDPHVLQRFRAFPRRDLKIKFLLFDVHQQERPRVRAAAPR